MKTTKLELKLGNWVWLVVEKNLKRLCTSLLIFVIADVQIHNLIYEVGHRQPTRT